MAALIALVLWALAPGDSHGQAVAMPEASAANHATTPTEPPVVAVAEVIDQSPALDADLPLYAAPTRLDGVGRVLASVAINDRGPFRFVVDTGANRTAISTRLAKSLDLPLDAASTIEVHGVTGSAHVPAVSGMRLQVGEIRLEPRRLPVLEDVVFADADGFLGVEGLQESRIEIDFVNDRVSVHRSTGKRAPPGYLVVPARFDKGGLLLVNGRVGRVRAKVILDTGAEFTIGNLALHRALSGPARSRKVHAANIVGATPGTVPAVALAALTISLGEAQLREVPVTFADVYLFSLWGLAEAPALIVGMDVLGTVDRFVVDYVRREFQLWPRGGTDSRDRPRCDRADCPSATEARR